MTDTNSAPQIPTVAQGLVHDFAQKIATTVATALVVHGFTASSNMGVIVNVGTGVLVYGAGCIWTYRAVITRTIRQHLLLKYEPPK